MPSKLGTDFLRQLAKYIIEEGNGFAKVHKQLKIVSGGDGNCLAEFKVDEQSVNTGNTLHGGMTATLIDTVTTLALMTTNAPPGVSVNLSVNYLKPAQIGDVLTIDAKKVKVGKTLAHLTCNLKVKDTEELIAFGTHTKFIGTK